MTPSSHFPTPGTSEAKEWQGTVLILLPRQIGDVIVGTSLVNPILKNWPKAKIVWVVAPMAVSVLKGLSQIHELLILPKKRKGFWGSLLNTISSIGTFLKIRRFKACIAIDAMANQRTALLSYISGAKTRVSFSTRGSRNIFYTHLVHRDKLNKSYLGMGRLELLRPLGLSHFTTEDANSHIAFSQKDIDKVKTFFKEHGVSHEKCILLSPTHRRDVRRWPVEKYARLAEKLNAEGYDTLWLWGPGEKDLIEQGLEQIHQQFKEKQLVPPLWSLNEVAALSSLCALWVGNSNGLSHVAVAAGCKTVQLHGPTSPLSWTHSDKESHRAVQRKEGCILCEKNTCALQKRECLEELEVEKVYEECIFLLGKVSMPTETAV